MNIPENFLEQIKNILDDDCIGVVLDYYEGFGEYLSNRKQYDSVLKSLPKYEEIKEKYINVVLTIHTGDFSEIKDNLWREVIKGKWKGNANFQYDLERLVKPFERQICEEVGLDYTKVKFAYVGTLGTPFVNIFKLGKVGIKGSRAVMTINLNTMVPTQRSMIQTRIKNTKMTDYISKTVNYMIQINNYRNLSYTIMSRTSVHT